MFEKTKKLKIAAVVLIGLFLSVMTASATNATTCTDAGEFSGVCDVLVNIFNATIAVISIVTTGNNASVVITAVIVLAIVGFIIDLARGKNSYIAKKFEKI